MDPGAELEFEEQKAVEEPHDGHMSRHSRHRSGNRSKRRPKKTHAQKMSRTALVGAGQPAKRGHSEHNIMVQGDSVVVDKNRSQAVVPRANDGSVGASDSVNGVVKRNTRSKSNGRNHEEQMLPRTDLVFRSGEPPSNQDALNRSVKPVLMTDMEHGAALPSLPMEENKILEIQDLAVNKQQSMSKASAHG